MERRLKLFFAQLFLWISSVFTEQSQICVRRKEVWARRFVGKVPRTSGKVITTKSCDQDVYWCRILDNSWCRTVFHDERHWRILTIHRFSGLTWPPCQETKIHLNHKVGSKGIQNLVPYWKLQFVAHKVNMEWRSELSLWTKTILTLVSEFLMAWMSWSRTWTTRSRTTTSRKPQKCSSKNMRWNFNAGDFASRSKAKAKPQRRFSASSSTRTIPIGERELGLMLNHGKFSLSDFQCRRNWFIFFVMEVYFETMMERLFSGE